jgi:hypothetical protein
VSRPGHLPALAIALFLLSLPGAPAMAESKEPLPSPPLGNPMQLHQEVTLDNIDLESEEIRFLPFDAGCSIVLRVQERYIKRKQERWRNIAVMKTRSGFTYLQSEVGYYRLGKYLDLDIFAVTVYRELLRASIEKLVAALEQLNYNLECKEKAREKLVGELQLLLLKKEPKLKVILKEWLPHFKNFASDGFTGLPKVFAFNEHLTKARSQPPDEVVEFPARRRSKRSRRYTAKANVRAMVMDISNLMVLDAVASQYDRWGGHNLHFRLTDGSEFVEGEDEVRRGGLARILALDNGSAMRSETTKAFEHLQLHVGRFDRDFIARLRVLKRWFKEEPRAARKWLGIPRYEFRNLRKNLRTVLKFVDDKTRNNPRAWFEEKGKRANAEEVEAL